MNVFTYYDAGPRLFPGNAGRFRAWEQSWSKAGWTPRLLTSRMAKLSPLYNEVILHTPKKGHSSVIPLLALHYAGGGWFVPQTVLNLSFKPKNRNRKVIFYFPGIMWATKRGVEEVLNAICIKQWSKFFDAHFQTLDLGVVGVK